MRTIGVKLQADVTQYKNDMAGAGKVTKDFRGDLATLAKAGDLTTVTRQADGVGDALERVAAASRRDLGEMERHAAALDRQITEVEASIRSLAKGYAETGKVELFDSIQQQQAQLSKLKNVKNLLPEPAEVAKAGAGIGARLGEGILKAVPPQLTAAIAAGGVAAAPLLATALVGGVAGGAALAGIGAGIALALDDPAIEAEAKSLGSFINEQMRRSAGAFAPEMLRTFSVVRSTTADLADEMDRIFASSANQLVPMTGSVSTAVTSIVEGLDRVVTRSEPALTAIGNGIEMMGSEVERFLTMVSENADAGGRALDDMFSIIQFGISSLTTTVGVLAKIYNFSTQWTRPFRDGADASNDFAAGANRAGDSTLILGEKVEETGKKAKVAKEKIIDLHDAIATIIGKNLSAAEAQIAHRQAVEDATKAIDKKRRVTDDEASALINLAKSANTTTKALDEQGRTALSAAADHERNRKKLIETARAMGYTKGEAKRLADQYLATPKNVTTRVSAPGTPQSEKQVREFNREVGKVQRRANTAVSVTGKAKAYRELNDLLVAQMALEKGIPVSEARAVLRKNFAGGGWTGPGATYDEAGIVHADEYVIKKSSRRKIERKHPGILDVINEEGDLPGYAAGGAVNWPFPTTAHRTRIPSRAEVLAAVVPAGPSGGATGPWMERLLEDRFGMRMISGYRPGSRTLSGNLSYHARNRAVDFPPSEAMARFMYGNYNGRLKEAITPYQQWNVHNGRDKRWTGAVWNQHNFAGGNAHNHFAMADGGTIREPVWGIGQSGATYTFGERGSERVIPNYQTDRSSSGATTVLQVTFSGPVGSPYELQQWLTGALDDLKRRGRA